MSTTGVPANPYTTPPAVAFNEGTWTKSKSHLGTQAFGFNALFTLVLANNISAGAGLTGSTLSAVTVLPQASKIPKVAVACGAIDLFNGTETFNIIVESPGDYSTAQGTGPMTTNGQPGAANNTTGTPFGQGIGVAGVSYTAGVAQTVGPSDNSGYTGYPTQFAIAGTALFAQDAVFGPPVLYTSGPLNGQIKQQGFSNVAAGTTGASGVFIPNLWDTVYAAGTVLSLRLVTTASTGSIANLCVVLLCQTVDTRPSNDRPIPCFSW